MNAPQLVVCSVIVAAAPACALSENYHPYEGEALQNDSLSCRTSQADSVNIEKFPPHALLHVEGAALTLF